MQQDNHAITSSTRPAGLWALAVVLLFCWLIRGVYIFQSGFPVALNGVYYPVQARSVLDTGWLAIPDLPFLFYFHAALGWFVSSFMPLNDALMFVTRLVDTVFPVLVAVPVYLFSKRFSAGTRRPRTLVVTVLLVGVVTAGNVCLFRMAGDFQKNSFALPFFLMYVYFLYTSMLNPSRRNISLAVLCFAMVGVTHIGATALTLTFTAIFFCTALLLQKNYQKLAVTFGLLIAALGLVLLLVSLYDPARVSRLFYVLGNPLRLFSNSPLLAMFSPPRRGPGGFAVLYLIGNIIVIAIMVFTLLTNKSVGSATRTLLWSSGLCTLFFSSPVIHFDLLGRFVLMAPFALVPLYTFFIARISWGWIVGIVIAVAVLFVTVPMVLHSPRGFFSQEKYNDLRQFKAGMGESNPLILAHHGLEWWVAWVLETDITSQPKRALEAMERYDALYCVKETGNNSLMMLQPPMPQRGGNHPPERDSGRSGKPSGMAPFFAREGQAAGNPFSDNYSEYFTLHEIMSGRYYALYRLEPIVKN